MCVKVPFLIKYCHATEISWSTHHVHTVWYRSPQTSHHKYLNIFFNENENDDVKSVKMIVI